MRGTPAYYPYGQDTKDGSSLWDVLAFAAIVLESDMEVDAYVRVQTERGAVFKAEKYLEEGGFVASPPEVIEPPLNSSEEPG